MSTIQPPEKKRGNQRLREERLRRHWSQQELADRLGTTVTSVKRWERRAATPSAYFRMQLTALLGKSAQELGFYGDAPSSAQEESTTGTNRTTLSLVESTPDEETASSDLAEDLLAPVAPSVIVQDGASTRIGLREKNQARMIELVETIWIRGMLEQSLHGATMQALGLYEQPDAVANPWRLMLQELDRPVRLLPTGTSIAQVYDATNGQLLIFGNPGAGKTTLLLDLARTLLERARQDAEYAVPIVFNLSSWTLKRLELDGWLMEELQEKYQVPRALARQWLASDAIIPLLDGLDEVAASQRTACIETINRYRHSHGLVPTVVCCRQADYLTQRGRLLLRSAVQLQPLTAEQIQEYLSCFGEQVEGLRLALAEDAELRELAATPLMLNVLTFTYHGASQDEVLTADTLTNRRHHIFERYVGRMLKRRGASQHTTSQQTISRLAWLARQLIAHQEMEFHLEHLQFDWLAPGWKRRAMHGISIGCIQGLLLGVIFFVLMSLYHGVTSGLITGFAVGIWNAIVVVLLNGILGVWADESVRNGGGPLQHFSWRSAINLSLNNRVLYGLLFALLNSSFISLLLLVQKLYGSLQQGGQIAMLAPILYGFLYGFLVGCSFSVLGRVPQEIRPAETVNWSWKDFRKNVWKYVAIGIAIGLIHGIIYPWVIKVVLVAATGLSALLIAGISHSVLEPYLRIRPNQGIWRSARNAWQTGIVSGLYMWLLVAALFGYFYGPLTGLLYGVVPGLCVGFCLAMQRGGTAFFLHMTVRVLLWWERALPWNVTRFLDEAADRVLLRKIGGGYIFVHRFLLEYFASLENADTSRREAGKMSREG